MKSQIRPTYSKIVIEREPFMNPAQEQIRKMAVEGNIVALQASVDLATENPQGEMAKSLETVSLRIMAHDLFTKTKSAVAHLHQTRPVLEGSESFSNLAEYEEKIKGYLKAHQDTWHEIVGTTDTERIELTKSTLGKLSNKLSDINDSNKNQDFIAKAFAEMGDYKVDNRGLRNGIAGSSAQITESVWGVVMAGRAAYSDILEGQQTDQVRTEYQNTTDTLFLQASDIATNYIVVMNAFKPSSEA